MRYLNQVKPHEKFVASGLYRIVLRDSGNESEEAWTIHELPDGTWLIRADYKEQGKEMLSRLVEVLYEPPNIDRTLASGVTRLNVFEFDNKKRVRQNLVFFDEYVQVGFSVNDEDRVYLEFPLPEDYVVAGASYIMRGLNILRLAHQADEQPLPILLDFDWQKQEIVWWKDYSVTPDQPEVMQIDGRSISAQKFNWKFGVENQLNIWLDTHAVTLKLTSPYEETQLKDYSRRPEP